MKQEAYNALLSGLKAYNNSLDENHGNIIHSISPQFGKDRKISFPLTIFKEIRNTPVPSINSHRERVASVGYRLDIFAQDKGANYSKFKIARDIAEFVDKFMSDCAGLLRVSYNENDLENNGAIEHITLVYSGYFDETRLKFLRR